MRPRTVTLAACVSPGVRPCDICCITKPSEPLRSAVPRSYSAQAEIAAVSGCITATLIPRPEYPAVATWKVPVVGSATTAASCKVVRLITPVPEIAACAKQASGVAAEINFVPHSGPFARGIHVTVQAALREPLSSAAALEALTEYYRGCPFVRVTDTSPRVKDVAASNYSNLSAVANGKTIAVMSVLDNLNKGAAGGAVQWMNRLLGFPETAGLTAPAPGWT